MTKKTRQQPPKSTVIKIEGRPEAEPNNVKRLRIAAGLSVRELADKASLRSEEIERIETGARKFVRLDVVEAICNALGQSEIADVFPPAREDRVPEDKWLEWYDNNEAEGRVFQRTNIDFNPEQWVLRFTLRSGRSDVVPIDSHDVERLMNVFDDESLEFIGFDSNGWHYALNPEHVRSMEFFKIDDEQAREADAGEPADSYSMLVLMAGETEGIRHILRPAPPFTTADDDLEENEMGRNVDDLQTFLEQTRTIGFWTDDERRVILKTADIALIAVDLRCIDGKVTRMALSEPKVD